MSDPSIDVKALSTSLDELVAQFQREIGPIQPQQLSRHPRGFNDNHTHERSRNAGKHHMPITFTQRSTKRIKMDMYGSWTAGVTNKNYSSDEGDDHSKKRSTIPLAQDVVRQAVRAQQNDEDDVKIETLTLMDHQIAHSKQVMKGLSLSPFFVDVSTMGAGKTPLTLWVALQLQLPIAVLCPKSVKGNWMSHAKKYGIKIEFLMTYESLRGKTKAPLGHDYLIRKDTLVQRKQDSTTVKNKKQSAPSKPVYKTEFKPTSDWEIIVQQQGVLLVIDEGQRAKNDTTTSQAVAALAGAIVKCLPENDADNWKPRNRSRVMILSATWYDKKEHAQQMLTTTGLIDFDCEKITEQVKQRLCDRLANLVRVYPIENKDVPAKLLLPCHGSSDEVDAWMHKLIVEIIKPRLFSSMRPPKIPFPLRVKNLYVGVPHAVSDKCQELLDGLSNVVRKMKKGQFSKDSSMGQVTVFLSQIEAVKRPIMLALARQYLKKVANSKVILFVWFLESVTYLQQQLEADGFPVLILTGQVSDMDRMDAIDCFNEPNNRFRVFIAITTVGSVGINLQDKQGGWPRFTIGMPHYRITDMHQAAGRTYRTGTKSQPEVVFLYLQCNGQIVEEASLLKSIASKSKVLGDLSDKTYAKMIQQKQPMNVKRDNDDDDKIVYPGMYPNVTLSNLVFDSERIELIKQDPSQPVSEVPIG